MNMEDKVLSASEICRIIRVCSESGVKSLHLGALTIELGFEGPRDLTKKEEFEQQPLIASPLLTSRKNDQDLPLTNSEQSMKTENSPAPETLLTIQDMESFKESVEEQLLIDDPYQFELMVMDRDLEASSRLETDGQQTAQGRGSQ
jgi:hypothetical protein